MQQRTDELTWERHDGEISAADRALLESLLEADPVARDRAKAVQELSAQLEEAGRQTPVPPELRPRIRAAIAAMAASSAVGARRAPRRSALASLRDLFTPPAAPRLAYLAACLAGLIVGAGGLYLVQSTGKLGPIPEQELYGTMRARAGGGVDLELPGGAGTLTLRREGPVLEIEAGLTAELPESADELRVRANGLRIRGLETQPGSAARLEAGAEAITLAHLGAGRHRLTVEVPDAGAPVELLVFGRGRPILRREIRLTDL